MARPKSDDPRVDVMRFRTSPAETARIKERAIASGMKLPDFLRARALGQKPRGLQRPEPEPQRPPARPVNPTVAAAAVERQEVADEVEEAKLRDEEAYDAFVERRTRQLYGQGKTMLVARRLVKEEWENRGTTSA